MDEKPWLMIVGGAGRLGLGLARELSGQHRLILTGSRPGGAGELSGLTDCSDIRRLHWDSNDTQLASKMMTDLGELGEGGILIGGAVLAAGTFPRAPFGSWDAEGLGETWGMNLTFPFLAAQAIVPHMGEGACLQFLLDACIHRPMPGRLPYSAAKAGLACLVAGLAKLLAPGIRVVGHAIGTMLPDDPQNLGPLADRTLLKRVGSPAELARAVAFARDSPSLTGEVLTLDGGARWL